MQNKRVFLKNTPASVFPRLNLGNVAGVSCVCLLATTAPIAAQVAPIVPDATLPNNSIVTESGNRVTIDGGTNAGGNLFHSFEEFSVPSGGEAFFNNALTVENIIARVTGMGLTNIDGILGANGSANLFLLNPNGIVFGADAALNLGGSFFATTADRLFWEDGSEFSATNPGTPPLLTINGPIGFELRANPGSIVNQSRAQSRAIATGADGSETVTGLQVGPGQTIALVGGNINLEAGNLSAPEGRIELASIRNSELRREGAGFSAVSSEFLAGDIQLSQASIVDASGEGGGDIQVQGRRISVKDESQIQSITIGGEAGGAVTVRAAELVEIEGNSPSEVLTGIISQSIGTGKAGDVTIETGRLIVRDGIVSASTLGSGSGGNLAVRASDSVEVSAGLTDGLPRGLVNVSIGAGNSGNLTVETGRLVVRDGAFVASGTRGSGNGGNLTIRASDSVEAIGTSPDGLSFTTIQSAATQGSEEIQMRFGSSVVSGNAGNLTIETARLIVRDGATVSTSTEGSGTGGNLTIRASESIETSGVSGDGRFPSSLLGDTSGSGAGGDLTLETGRLFLENGGLISVRTFGAGSGGNMTVNASESVELVGTGFEAFQVGFIGAALSGLLDFSQLRGGFFAGNAGTGSSGDIAVNAPELILRNGAVISTTSFGEGAGGNLTVTASERVEAIASGLFSANLTGSGTAGAIAINAPFLTIRDGANISTVTLGSGPGGNVTVEASQQMEVLSTPAGTLVATGIFTNTIGGTGTAGNIAINTGKLVLRDGGQIVASSGAATRDSIVPFGGAGGNVTVTATDSVELSGVAADGRVTSALGTTTFSSSPAGLLSISTRQLTIRDGAGLFAATEEAGRGGTLNLEVSEKVELIGTSDIGSFRRSGLFATSGSDLFPIEASGRGGDLRVTAGELIVRDGAIVSVDSVESGAAGTLEVVADSIKLENSAAIDATTISGAGGNISLISPQIQLRGTSQIATDAGNTDGGNIAISTQTLAALENSDITANAQQGRGGRVNIDATGIFGTAFRAAPTPRSDITATSNLGPQFSGVVEINAPDIDASAGLVVLEGETLDLAGLVDRDVCANAGAGSEFVVTGRGGLPPNPNEPLTTDTVWRDERFLVSDSSPTEIGHEREAISRDEGKYNSQESAIANQPFVEAQGWIVSSEGDIILVAVPPKVTPNGSALTPPTCRQQL